jgi:hypothetical protein
LCGSSVWKKLPSDAAKAPPEDFTRLRDWIKKFLYGFLDDAAQVCYFASNGVIELKMACSSCRSLLLLAEPEKVISTTA